MPGRAERFYEIFLYFLGVEMAKILVGIVSDVRETDGVKKTYYSLEFGKRKVTLESGEVNYFSTSDYKCLGKVVSDVEFVPTSDQKERLDYINSNSVTDVFLLTKNLKDLGDYIETGFVNQTSEASIKFNLQNGPVNNTREIFLNTIKDIIKEIRKSKVCDGIKFKGLTFSIDTKSISAMSDLLNFNGFQGPYNFKSEEGEFIYLPTKDELGKLLSVAIQEVQKLFSTESKVVSEISTYSDLDLFNIYNEVVNNGTKETLNKLFDKILHGGN